MNGKIEDFYYCNSFFFKKWLREAKNYFFSHVLTIGQGSGGIINVSGKRISMAERLMRERIDHIEAQTWYRPYSKLHYIRKKIEKLEKTV